VFRPPDIFDRARELTGESDHVEKAACHSMSG
jgi:hypothetical protein